MKHKIFITIFLAASSFADQRSTLHNLHNGYRETNPIYGQRPSTLRFVATHTAINVSEVVALWKTKGKLHKLAVVLASEEGAEDTGGAVHNIVIENKKREVTRK